MSHLHTLQCHIGHTAFILHTVPGIKEIADKVLPWPALAAMQGGLASAFQERRKGWTPNGHKDSAHYPDVHDNSERCVTTHTNY